jgi:crotonobetainyl-CoA:carnitine CoA-transferase CaiB-like acyl-CoA transferase
MSTADRDDVGGRGPLAGIKVIDLGQVVAAPMAGSLFADFGADVIKVEQPAGDPIRRLGKFRDDIPLWWKVSGRNKRTIALDLRDQDDLAVFRRLVEQADVLLENFAPGVMERLGIDYERLRAINPGLVMLSISGFGQTGPLRSRKAFGRTAEAYSGLAYTTGYPDRPPVHMALPIADCTSGLLGAFAVMMALRERDLNGRGEGQHVDVALYESVFRLQEYIPIHYDQLGFVTEREGTTNSYVAPVGTWTTHDGRLISFTGSTQGMVERLFEAMGRPDLIGDPRFATNSDRLANRDVLSELLTEWFSAHRASEVEELFERHEVAATPILSIAEVFEEDHYWERGALVEVPDQELGTARIQGVSPKLSRTPGEIRWLGHGIDEDRDAILDDWLGRTSVGPTEGGAAR